MTEPLFKQVTMLRAPPHLFGAMTKHIPQPDRGRHEQHERACPVCGLVRITVIPPQGEPWREYRFGEHGQQFLAEVQPECVTEGVTLEFGKGAA